ncbi:hypothetical protein FRC04_012210 [Tulasnella sp. 424]|nr:hypothetical protein FRC04_012210 [Tulasnella sp. 424]
MYTTGPTNPYAGSIEDSGSVSCYRPTAIIPTHLLIYRARAIPKELSRKGTTAGGPHSPPADLARSGTTTDTRRRGRKNPFEFASLPKASDADPVVLPSAGQSGSTRAQNTQQGFVKIPPQRHGSQMHGAKRPSTRPTSMLTPSTRLGIASLIAAPPPGANPENRKPPSAASNTAGIRSPRLHDRSRTPPNDDPLLNAKANPASPTASNPVNFSSPAWSGPAPRSGMFSRKTELQKRPVSFAGWGYEAVQSPVSTPKKAMASPSSAAAPFFGGSNSANRASYTGPGAASSGHGNPANNLARDTDSWPDEDEDEDEDELDCEPDVLFLVKSPPRSSS